MQQIPLQIHTRLAKVSRWLCWITAGYAFWWVLTFIMSWGWVPMNPWARASMYGRFKWYFPGILDLICLLAPIPYLYLFQHHLNKGVKTEQPDQIEKGMYYLHRFLGILAIVIGIKLIFDYGVRQIW